ncbi:Glutathione S-transferase/chloride channel C-terminal [Penicillium lagena]|uniref:Glutathione S-transferase/chloride channel C-terminal n=1 Tax=Penicillium lagena TaxID=94218 RepID=UPI00253F730B|nr:Glutathione S-transferase/chloride channel C-terminal [Penicillium lagena]KAJ5606184.1 Glutathione S-transferase/chloride channel C-terminal [Penicillium lagena]
MDVFHAYTYSTAAWLSLQSLSLMAGPSMIIAMLLDEARPASSMEIYFARSLGISLLTIAALTVMLTGSIPLTSSIASPVTTEDSDPKAPYALPTLMVTSVFHAVAAFYAYTWYAAGGQGTFALGVAGYSILAAIGLWCVLFASGDGRISRKTGADKRTTGFPFANSEAAKKKAVPSFRAQQPIPQQPIPQQPIPQQPIPQQPIPQQPIPQQPIPQQPIPQQPIPQQPLGRSRQVQSLQDVVPVFTIPGFVRAPRPGEPMNTFMPTQFHSPPSHTNVPPPPRQCATTGTQTGESNNLGQDAAAVGNNARAAQNNHADALPPPNRPELRDLECLDSVDYAGQLYGMKLIPNPPDLEYWRDRLFNVDEEMITMSEQDFQTYFPHVDNVYSYRSTQQYKRWPMVSHYWGCRLKGRPGGTPKPDNPNVKKRKRTERPRDLCQVVIKITEHLPGRQPESPSPREKEPSPRPFPGMQTFFSNPGNPLQLRMPYEVFASSSKLPEGHPGSEGRRYFTVQRVNGNGLNGKDDGIPGGHTHTLEESDQVKKDSVQRYLLKGQGKGRKSCFTNAALSTSSVQQGQTMSTTNKAYHTKATGLAAETAARHGAETELQLYGSCFCPFVQRVWIALELKGIPYQYIEVDPYEKPESLLEVNPRGLVPALRHNDWGCYESTVLLEYLEDCNEGTALLPSDAKLRAHCRLWADHINRHIVPTFYRVLQEQDQEKQIAHVQELHDAIHRLIEVAHPRGPFFLGPELSFVDVQAAPWILRLSRVLKPYRGWPDAEEGTRWASWVNALETNEHVQATTSTDELYLDSYKRYAENRPNTSQVANAINSGRGLP